MRFLSAVLTATAVAFASAPAFAGSILVNEGSGFDIEAEIHQYDPIGQSFTAEDTQIASIGFFFGGYRGGISNAPIVLELHQGGAGGVLVGSTSFTLTPGFEGFFDADFSGVTLTVGQVYSAVLFDDSQRWGMGYGNNTYAGGTSIINGVATAAYDARFRVLVGTPIPEPATLGLTAMGVAAAALRRRRA